jgi:hypothetical protein
LKQTRAIGGATRLGNFDEHHWGDSVSVISNALHEPALEVPLGVGGAGPHVAGLPDVVTDEDF